jgi:tetratricopeptide (TPR) repeat protein
MSARSPIDLRLIRGWLSRVESTRHSYQCRSAHSRINSPQERSQETEAVYSLQRRLQFDMNLLALPCLSAHEQVTLLDRLAQRVQTLFTVTHSRLALEQAIELRRNILSYRPVGHAVRALACLELAAVLGLASQRTGCLSRLDEAIVLQREALQTSPVGHEYHTRASTDLSVSLRNLCQRKWDAALMEEGIELGRDVLETASMNSTDRGLWLHGLATSLIVYAHKSRRQAGIADSMSEVTSLTREAWHLLPVEHPAREECCRNLASFLFSQYNSTGILSALNEAAIWGRNLADLASNNTSIDPTPSYSILAQILRAQSRYASDYAFLSEALQLERRMMDLRPVGHRDRDRACADLASSLKMIASRTGDFLLLEEAISLERETLSLRQPGHYKRDQACQNLAYSLFTLHDWRRSESYLDEAITLAREALALRPEGHRNRGKSCATLATALRRKDDPVVFGEIIELYRESFRLNGSQSPVRARQCAQLGEVLLQHSMVTGDATLIPEAEALHREALKLYPDDHPDRWNLLISLAKVNTNPAYTKRDQRLALAYLKQAIIPRSDSVHRMLNSVAVVLQRINQAGVADELQHQLLGIYTAAIELAISIAGYALSGEAQLEYLTACRVLGPAACTLALNLGMTNAAVEVLERARGVVWAQKLQMRDPHLEGVPKELRLELVTLFACISGTTNADNSTLDDMEPSYKPPERDLRHQQHERIQEIVHYIRATLNMDHFMRGPTCDTLTKAATDHPVVILFANGASCSALVLKDSDTSPYHLSLPGLSESGLPSMSLGIFGNSIRGPEDKPDDRAMIISRSKRLDHESSDRILAVLWKSIVRPVLQHLGLLVSVLPCTFDPPLTGNV